MAADTCSTEGAIATITLDKPPANSYDLAMMSEFSAAVDGAINDGRTRVVIVNSASEKFFCAGADVKKFLEGDVNENMEMIRTSQATFKRMAAASQVFIAEIAGHALGGGLELALACDLRYASAGSYKLGTPEVTLGLLPGNGGTQRLTRMIGPARALDVLLTGRAYSPEEALGLGVVTGVFEAERIHDAVRTVAQRFAAGPALALSAIKRCVYEGGQMALDDGLALEARQMEALFRSEDALEGMSAFAEKREAQFVGA
jgi:enoyl-CoA hydratase/carnithine racemase